MDLDSQNKILFEHLLTYARFSVKDLAKLLKVSKATIIKRLKFLEDNNYISRYDAIINWQKLPFIKKVYFVKVSENFSNFEKEIISCYPVFSLIQLVGFYNYQIWCFFKNKEEQNKFENRIEDYEKISINISELIFPRVNFFDVPLELKIPKIDDKIIKIGKIDVAIMKYLAEGHGRDSFYEISRKLKLPYDSIHYHGKNLINSNYFLKIIAQPGVNKFTLQTTCLLIEYKDNIASNKLYSLLKKTKHIISSAIGEKKVLVHFLSQTHLEYRETLSEITSLISRDLINSLLITHWDKILLNNRYPLEYLLSKNR